MASAAADGPSIGAKRLELEYQNTYYRMLQRRGDKVPSDAKQLEVPENMQAPLLEGIYRTRLKQQPPAEWKELDSDERTAKMREAVIASWAKSQVLLRQIGQARPPGSRDYLVEKGQLPDDRIYLIDVSFAEGEDKVMSTPNCTWIASDTLHKRFAALAAPLLLLACASAGRHHALRQRAGQRRRPGLRSTAKVRRSGSPRRRRLYPGQLRSPGIQGRGVGVRPAQRRDLHPDLRSQQAETHRVQALNRSLPRTGLVALLSLLPLAHAQADSLRCGSRLVSTGDSSADVLARCGEPRSRDSLGYREVVGEWGKRYEVEVQEWIYGPWNGMLYFVRFEGNRLSAIQSRRGD